MDKTPPPMKLDPQTVEACAKACEEQALQFLSPEYATGQPLSSITERFACSQCASAIRALRETSDE